MPTPVHPYSEYGVALRTLRSARSWLGVLLFVCVVAQFVGFSLMWWTQQPYEANRPQRLKPEITWFDILQRRLAGPTTQGSAMTMPSPEPFFPASEQSIKLNVRKQWDTTYTMAVPLTQMMALMSVCSQVIIVFLTLLVILVAQAPGVAQVTRSLIWSVLLLFMVLPWQYFARNFPFPGVPYGYQELLQIVAPHVVGEKVYGFQKLLVYGRFFLWPLASMVVLLIVSERFRSGLMLAIGHPLQSMMQPRSQGVTAAKPLPALGVPGDIGRKIG